MRIGRRLGELFGVRADEVGRVLWLASHSLFIGVYCAYFFSAANALFLDRFDVSALPLAYIAAGLVGYAAVMGFSRIEGFLPFKLLLLTNLGVLTVLSAAFWFLTRALDSNWVVFAMFVWVGPSFVLIFLGYWALAARLFDLRQGKRLFGLVGAGEEVATVTGLFSVPILVRFLGSPVPLLLIATAGLVGCFMVVRSIGWVYRERLDEGESDSTGSTTSTTRRSQDRPGLGALLRRRYFLLMAALVILFSISHYLVDFSFLSQIRVKFEGPTQIAQFIGVFFGIVKVLELIMKAFLSGRLLSQFGLKFGLMLMPVLMSFFAFLAIVIGGFGLGVAHLFVLVALAKLVWAVTRTSIFLPAFRVFYQPVRGPARLAYQTHVDGTAKQLATLLIGVVLLLVAKSGSYSALNLYYALLPLLAIWMVAAVWIYREYRTRLLANLSEEMGRELDASAAEHMIERLIKMPPELLENAAALLARVDAPAVVPMLLRMLREGARDARLGALRYLARLKALGGLDEVREVARSESDEELRAAARTTEETLKSVVLLSDQPERVRRLAESEDPAERDLAVSAVGYSKQPEQHLALTDLLWDQDRDVQRAALIAAGRVGSSAYWHRIISQLSAPMYANAATYALICAGDPVLGEVERAFSRVSPDVQSRILRIYERIGTPAAQALLVGKLNSSVLGIRRKALNALSRCAFQARGERVRAVETQIETVVQNIAWAVSSLRDIGDDKDVAELREALEYEVESGYSALFLLLSLLYDGRAVALVRANLESGRAEAGVYALEILDLLISPELKPMVFPLFEDLTPGQMLRRLDAVAPRQRMERMERLQAIINRQPDRIGIWPRVCALRALGRLSDRVLPDLVASLFHPHAMIQETAAQCMQRLDPGSLDHYLPKLQPEIQDRLRQVVAAEAGVGVGTVVGRTDALRDVPVFATLPAEALVALAVASEERVLKTGQKLPFPQDRSDAIFVTLDGELDYVHEADHGRPRCPLEPMSLVGFGVGSVSVKATAPSSLIRLDSTRLYELATEFDELIPVLLHAAQQLAPDAELYATAEETAEALGGVRPEAGELEMTV